MYTAEDSFDAADKINQILPDVHNSDEYVLVWLDVVSLSGKEITTTLTKKSSKKLNLGTCQKQLSLLMGKCTNKHMM